MILHIPHHSTYIPDEYRDLFVVSDEALLEEIQLMTDHNTDIMFGLEHPKITRVTAEVSRLLVDMERFRDDNQESMAKKGMGAVYTKRQNGTPLKEFPPEQREALLQRYYDPHHKGLEEAVQKELDEHGECLIIDCHSFPDEALPYEDRSEYYQPVDFCIGFDAFHVPEELVLDVYRFFTMNDYSVAINEPFSGSIVPNQFYQKDNRVKSMMIEVNRNLNVDEVKNLMNRLLPYLSGDRNALGKDDFDGDSLHKIAKLEDWTFSEGEDYINERDYIFPDDESLHNDGWHKSMDVHFSSPSCKCEIRLWMQVFYYFTKDNKLHTVDVDMVGRLREFPHSEDTIIEDRIYCLDSNEIICMEGEDYLYGTQGDELQEKLVALVRESYREELHDKSWVKHLEDQFKD
ncbi:N-formylglutamate amidohydrolase [Alteromonas sp. LMIT006]|uniref:N-formylglutamate amidohydrolase n=1 Tax=Alteromonadaceae TaxID=72275 RepID=UPI0020CA6916|nr:N-formylglutamate amidohydrolase [Alteromonas sp. LMIT006]UTP72770.1 N-formylglutamate amidohydrolase [Alteromonas sp. LMIT006]